MYLHVCITKLQSPAQMIQFQTKSNMQFLTTTCKGRQELRVKREGVKSDSIVLLSSISLAS